MAVNIAFREPSYYKRWRLLADEYGYDVTLVGPKQYEYSKFGAKMTFQPSAVHGERFKVVHVDMRKRKFLRNDWLSLRYWRLLMDRKPDIIYLIGFETSNVILVSVLYKFLFNSNCRIGIFTMRGIDMPLKGVEYRIRWRFLRKKIDFVNVHYPRGRDIIREQGRYDGVINLQTQIGVDKDIFFPCKHYRAAVRERYGIKDADFVFGAALRVESAKGVFEIVDACASLPPFSKFLLLGDGVDFDRVKMLVHERNLGDKVILTGKVAYGKEVAMYMNAMDCFVHVPKTTTAWVDTFPLVVVQAMACGLPVIASDSGAMHYQLGNDDMTIPEGNADELAKKMKVMASDPNRAKQIGTQMLRRVLDCFEIRHLNQCISETFEGVIIQDKERMAIDQTDMITVPRQ